VKAATSQQFFMMTLLFCDAACPSTRAQAWTDAIRAASRLGTGVEPYHASAFEHASSSARLIDDQ
jgi:hypothetical protein